MPNRISGWGGGGGGTKQIQVGALACLQKLKAAKQNKYITLAIITTKKDKAYITIYLMPFHH